MDGDLVTRDSAGKPLRWRDHAGVMHAVEGATIHPGDAHTRLMWARCGADDVPPGEAWAGQDILTCRSCAAIEHEERAPARAD